MTARELKIGLKHKRCSQKKTSSAEKLLKRLSKQYIKKTVSPKSVVKFIKPQKSCCKVLHLKNYLKNNLLASYTYCKWEGNKSPVSKQFIFSISLYSLLLKQLQKYLQTANVTSIAFPPSHSPSLALQQLKVFQHDMTETHKNNGNGCC